MEFVIVLGVIAGVIGAGVALYSQLKNRNRIVISTLIRAKTRRRVEITFHIHNRSEKPIEIAATGFVLTDGTEISYPFVYPSSYPLLKKDHDYYQQWRLELPIESTDKVNKIRQAFVIDAENRIYKSRAPSSISKVGFVGYWHRTPKQ